jgi:hypothetical protein
MTRDIGVGLGGFKLTCFSPRYVSGGATCPRNKTMVLLSAHLQEINRRAISPPDMSYDHRWATPTVHDPSDPIYFASPLDLAPSTRCDLVC